MLSLLGWTLFAAPADREEDVLAKLRARLGRQQEIFQRDVHRLGAGNIELEVFAESEMDPAMESEILSDFQSYGAWMLRDINLSPDGAQYLCQLHQLQAKASDLLVALYSFDIPLLHTERSVAFRVRQLRTPKSFTMLAESDAPPDALATGEGLLKVFPNETNRLRSWIYARGRIHLSSWLLYEALPEKVLSHETAGRVRILIDNYLREESQRRARRRALPSKSKAVPS